MNLDGSLELVVTDTSANVLCYDTAGQLVWEGSVSGTSSSGARIADVNLDGDLELVISTNDGYRLKNFRIISCHLIKS